MISPSPPGAPAIQCPPHPRQRQRQCGTKIWFLPIPPRLAATPRTLYVCIYCLYVLGAVFTSAFTYFYAYLRVKTQIRSAFMAQITSLIVTMFFLSLFTNIRWNYLLILTPQALSFAVSMLWSDCGHKSCRHLTAGSTAISTFVLMVAQQFLWCFSPIQSATLPDRMNHTHYQQWLLGCSPDLFLRAQDWWFDEGHHAGAHPARSQSPSFVR